MAGSASGTISVSCNLKCVLSHKSLWLNFLLHRFFAELFYFAEDSVPERRKQLDIAVTVSGTQSQAVSSPQAIEFQQSTPDSVNVLKMKLVIRQLLK